MRRSELAEAIAQTVRLEPARRNPPVIIDVPESSPATDDISRVVANGLMDVDDRGAFRPAEPIARQEAAAVLVRLAEKYRSENLSSESVDLKDEAAVSPQYRAAVFSALRANLLSTNAEGLRPREHLTREDAALAIYNLIGFPW